MIIGGKTIGFGDIVFTESRNVAYFYVVSRVDGNLIFGYHIGYMHYGKGFEVDVWLKEERIKGSLSVANDPPCLYGDIAQSMLDTIESLEKMAKRLGDLWNERES